MRRLWRSPTAKRPRESTGVFGISCTLAGGTDLHLANHILRIDLACTAYDWLFLFLVAVVEYRFYTSTNFAFSYWVFP